MAGMLFPDDDKPRITPPGAGLLGDQSQVSQGDALAELYRRTTAEMARQQQISADRGLWANGAPTQAGLLDAAQQYGNALMMGTAAPGDAMPAIRVTHEDLTRPDRPAFTISANGQPIGRASATGAAAGRFIDSVQIDPAFRGKGYATSIYNQIESLLGHDLVPSPLGLSDAATAVWQRRLRAMAPEDQAAVIDRSKAIGREFGIKDEHLNERLDPLITPAGKQRGTNT